MEWLLEPENLERILGHALSAQMIRDLAAFGLAALIHSSRVKKEIRAQFSHLTEAINSLSSALRQDLANQSERIGRVEKDHKEIKDRLTKIEQPKE